MGAALAFYTVFALAPGLLAITALAALLLGKEPAQAQIIGQIQELVGYSGAQARGNVWIGAAVTALLFTLGKFLIGLYLGGRAVVSVYGAAGSLIVILLRVYYSAQIVFFGAEFTKVS